MSRSIARFLAIVPLLSCLAGSLRAQADGIDEIQSSVPILPVNVRFQFVPQYFAQTIRNDLRYSSIEALIDNDPNKPWYEVILTDKTTGRRIFYCNSTEAMNALEETGTDAHYTAIQFSAAEKANSPLEYQIRLSDRYGQQIFWRFIMSSHVTEAEPGILPQPDAFGLVLMYANRRLAAEKGTTVMIGKKTNEADVSEPIGANEAFYAMGLTVAEIVPGTELWTINSRPNQLREGEKWILHSYGDEERLLVIEQAAEKQLDIRQVDPDDPFSAPAELDVLCLDKGFALRSVLFQRQSHNFRISFEPALPLLERGSADTRDVDFVVAEEGQAVIAHGKVSIQIALDAEHVSWQFDAPTWAK